MGFLPKIRDFILDLIFPRQCLGCSKENSYLCQECLANIELNKIFYCIICKGSTKYSELCEKCKTSYDLNAVWVVADYNNKLLQDLIHSFKYKYLQEISNTLSSLMIRYLEQNKILENFDINSSNAIFLPVPLHKKRYLVRGFNQSELLARDLSKKFQIATNNFLKRIKNTQSQVDLKKAERQANVSEAFSVLDINRLDKNKKVILIDDVVTTGSTLNECARALKNVGFQEIYGLVIAQKED